jgi:signal transduction histidine kinase
MGETALNIFLAFISIIMLLFIVGIVLFVRQYRRKKIQYEMEKNKVEEQHRIDLLNIQLESQQQIMQHIGQEIHDNVGQKLTLASLYTKHLAHGESDPLLIEKATAIGSIIDNSLDELRQLSKSLVDPHFTSANILSLLNEEAAKINNSNICRISIQTDLEAIALAPGDKSILFRLLQEFIQNSLKHAGCRHIAISFEKQDSGIVIQASDDGKGFNIDTSSNGIGLYNMKRRASQLNAEYTLTSHPGIGTFLSLHLQTSGS